MKQQFNRVRFSEDTNTSHVIALHDANEHELLYTPRSEYVAYCRQVVEETNGYQSQNIGAQLDDIYSCSSNEQIRRLVKLHRVAAPARGLERQISDEHRDNRQGMRRRQIVAVLTQQQTQLKSGMKYDERAAILASVSEDHSYEARVFARVLALADEKIVKEDIDEDATSSCSTQEEQTPRKDQKKTSSGKLVKVVQRISRGSKGGGLLRTKLTRRNSPSSAGEEFRDSLEVLVRAQERY